MIADAFADRDRLQAVVKELVEGLNVRDLFINPHILDKAAEIIDCGPSCECLWHEYDTNAGGCRASENGDYCANDLAETLRALAKLARKREASGALIAKHL